MEKGLFCTDFAQSLAEETMAIIKNLKGVMMRIL